MSVKNKNVFLWGTTLLFLCIIGFQMPAPAQWQRPLQPSLAGGVLTCLALHPLDESKFLVASGQQVFEAGKENAWQPLWSQADAGAPIKRLFSFAVLPDTVFAITNQSAFMGNLKDRSWQAIYKDPEKTPLAFTVCPANPNRWFLGTQKGLWETENAGKTWLPSLALPGSRPVPLVLFTENRLYVATENALFLSLNGEPSQQIFALPGNENDPAETTDNNLSVDVPFYLFKIHDLLVSKKDPQELFLATTSGVFRSCDGGRRWEPLPKSGLQSSEVLQLAYSKKKNCLYAATPHGVYAFDAGKQKWTCFFEGLARGRTQSMTVLNEEKLLAITEDGFVQYPLGPFGPETGPILAPYQPPEEALALFKELLALEPSPREVHKRVIRYADVSNDKIKRWHAASRLAGFLPTFSFGKNLDRSTSISTYSGKYITGPEDTSKGWDADVSWDLGDMVYSSDQTSIDSREKMMVELRNDLLSEATRIYYERRRLQIELVFTPPVSEQEHLENLLRMDELTSLLDGMTDGFFSERLERIYKENPVLDKLWIFQKQNGG